MRHFRRVQKKVWIFLGIILAVFVSALGFGAEKFPSRPITITVPWAPGGRTDLVTRMIAPIYERILQQPVIVVNKPGASGFIGYKSVSTSKPDGYTLGMAGGNLMVVQYTEENIRWDEFKWIGQCYSATVTVSVNAESPWKTIEEFVDYARKNPMKLKHGKSDTFGNSHLFSQGFAKAAGIKLAQITYKGDGPAALALASKEVDVSCQPLGPLRPFIEAGKIRVLALQADKRSPQLPDVPTLKEKGINWVAGTFEGLIAPKDTPREISTVLESALEKAMKDPNLADSFNKLDLVVEFRNSNDFTAFVAQQDKSYREILKEIGFIKK